MTADPSSSAPGASFQERFAALEREWRQLLPGKLAEARQRMGALRAAPGDKEALEELHRLLHTLAGSAGTFGLPALGEAARGVENQLTRVLDLPSPQAGDLDAADAALQALVDAAPEG